MNGSGMKALIWAVIIALLVASVLCVVEKVFTPTQVIDEIFKGMSGMLPITFVLLFGFTMGNVVKGSGYRYISFQYFPAVLSPALLPCTDLP